MAAMILWRDDGEVWEVAPGFDTDENSVKVRAVIPARDPEAAAAGATHVLSDGQWGKGLPAHEVRRLR